MNELAPLVRTWMAKIRLAWKHKKENFQDDADEAMRFFDGPKDFVYGTTMGSGFVFRDQGGIPKPSVSMSFNKTAELVQIFGPALYHRNPIRQANPRKHPLLEIGAFGDQNDPMVQQMYQQLIQAVNTDRTLDRCRAALTEFYLNYTPAALDLKTQSRWTIDEAIIKGMGILVTKVYDAPNGAMRMAGSFFTSVNNLVIDPDVECDKYAKWSAIRCIAPYWEVEQKYGLQPDSLKSKATMESQEMQSQASSKELDYARKKGISNDLVVYWEVYSRMGMGGKLTGIREDLKDLDQYTGNNVYVVVCEGCEYPLNLSPELVATADDQMIQKAVQWPTPFWVGDMWPWTKIVFHPVPNKLWPASHLKFAMGELKFLNWAYSFLAEKVAVGSRDFIAVAKSAAEELKKQIQHGPNYSIIEIESLHGDIDKVVKFLQHPEFKQDIYTVIKGVEQNFDKRTGLTELMYGQTPQQMRSAQEASVKSDQLNIRPDDMANIVEDAMGEIALKEAFCAYWNLTGMDVSPCLGQQGGQWWDQFVANADPKEILYQLEYRIEAGSVRKPNRNRDQQNANQAMQTLFVPFMNHATATMDYGPVNALIQFWAKTLDMDAGAFMLKPPPPPPMPMPVKPNGVANNPALRRAG